MDETNDTETNTLPHDWTEVVWTDKEVTLPDIYSKLEEVNKKMDKIICYFGILNTSISLKRETHIPVTTTVTAKQDCDTEENYEIQPQIKQKAFAVSSSRGNFAKNLVNSVYSPEERHGRNCTGRSTSGSAVLEPLNQVKLRAIKNCVFEVYGVPPNLHHKVWREECVKAIDAFCRKERYKQLQAKQSLTN